MTGKDKEYLGNINNLDFGDNVDYDEFILEVIKNFNPTNDYIYNKQVLNALKVIEIIEEIVKSLPGISGGRLCSQTIIKINEKKIGLGPGDLVGIIGALVTDGVLTAVDYRLPEAKQISHTLFFPAGTKITVTGYDS